MPEKFSELFALDSLMEFPSVAAIHLNKRLLLALLKKQLYELLYELPNGLVNPVHYSRAPNSCLSLSPNDSLLKQKGFVNFFWLFRLAQNHSDSSFFS